MSATVWVYRQTERASDFPPDGCDLYTVGFYTPGGEWNPESDHATAEEAAARVHYLNGGVEVPA